jgi:hypothetical protein
MNTVVVYPVAMYIVGCKEKGKIRNCSGLNKFILLTAPVPRAFKDLAGKVFQLFESSLGCFRGGQ